VENPEKKIKNNLAGKTIHKNSGKELGRLYNLTNNYKGYKKLKSILEVNLAKVENLLVESTPPATQARRPSWRFAPASSSRSWRCRTATTSRSNSATAS
jgi:sporulation protein YlmC with PRC-barrel domain